MIHFLGAATARSTPSAVSAPTTFASLRMVEVCQLKLHPPRLDLREVQDVVDQGQQMRAGCVNIFEVLLLLLIEVAEHAFLVVVRLNIARLNIARPITALAEWTK